MLLRSFRLTLRTAGGVGDRSGRQVRRLYFGKQDHRSTVTYHDIRNQFRASDPLYDSNSRRCGKVSMKLKVLVADDERVIADTLALILKQNGFEATAVYSGEEAIETTKTFQPDVLISDVVMFGLNGIDAAIEILKILPNCKVLLLSGQSSTADLLDEASGRGHDFEIVAKPIPPSALLARLEELIHGPDEAEVAS